MLPSRSLNTSKLSDKTLEVAGDTLSSINLVLRVRWFLFLNQRRQFLSNAPIQKANCDVKRDDMKCTRTEASSLIPLPFLQVIHALATLTVPNYTASHRSPTKVMSESHDAQPIKISEVSRHFDTAIRAQLVAENVTTSRRQESQNSQKDKRRIAELLMENKRLRQANRYLDIHEFADRSPICEVTPCFHRSPAKFVSTACVIASIGDEDLEDVKIDTRLPFDRSPYRQSPALSRTIPTPAVEPFSNSQHTREDLITDKERTTKRLCFESPSETWSISFPSGVQDLEFASPDNEACFDELQQMSNAVFEVEVSSGRAEKSPEKKQKKEKKHKKAKKKKKRSRESDDEVVYLETREGDTKSLTTRYGVSKITPETVRGQGKLRKVDPYDNTNAFFDPRVKPYNPAKSHNPFPKQWNRAIDPNGKAIHRVTTSAVTRVLHRPDPEPPPLQNYDHFDNFCNASSDDDGLELPHESPEPPTKRMWDERQQERSAAASTTAQLIRNREEPPAEAHVLCSESFIENSSQVVASLATGSWLEGTHSENCNLSASDVRCRRVFSYDSSLLDEIGIDIEIPGNGAILVQRLSSWGTEDDLKALIRRLVRLSAIGRYQQIDVIICVDTAMSPSLAKDIAIIQSAPLGNVDCAVSFQLVTPRSMTGAIASSILMAKNQSCSEVDGAIFHSIGECTTQAAFLLRLVSSLTVFDALQLLRGKDGKSPRTLRELLGCPNGNGRSGAQLRSAVQAPLNPFDG